MTKETKQLIVNPVKQYNQEKTTQVTATSINSQVQCWGTPLTRPLQTKQVNEPHTHGEVG